MCAQRRLGSAWASAQSGQSLHCALKTLAFFKRNAKTLIRLGGCDKNATLLQGVRTADLRPSKDNARIVRQQPQREKSYVNCAGVSRLPCSSLACLHMAAALRSKKLYEDRKENGHVENLVFDAATACRVLIFALS